MFRKPSSLMDLSVHLVTWNVVTKPPDEELHNLLGLDDEERLASLPDFYVMGLQEVKAKPHSMLMDSLFEVQWVKAFRSALAEFDYVKVRVIRLQGLLLVFFAKREHLVRLQDIQTEYTRTGLGGVWGNKGAVTIRLNAFGCSLCFVNSHLAAHDTELKSRIEDYNAIVDEQVFRCRETENIMFHDYVFWLGDLNFRIEHFSTQEVIDLTRRGQFKPLLEKDQLLTVRREGLAFNGFEEGTINFAPTYKFFVGESEYDTTRKPAWTDRILYKVNADVYEPVVLTAKQTSYRSHTGYTASDHKPVSAHFVLKVFNCLPDRFVQFAPISQWSIGSEQKVIYYTLTTHKTSQWDWIGLFKADFSSLDDYVAYVWASSKGDPEAVNKHPLGENWEGMSSTSGIPIAIGKVIDCVQEEVHAEQDETGHRDATPPSEKNGTPPSAVQDETQESDAFQTLNEEHKLESLAHMLAIDDSQMTAKTRATSNVPGLNMVQVAATMSGVSMRKMSQPVSVKTSLTLHKLASLFVKEARIKYTVTLPELLTTIPGSYRLVYLSDGLNDIHGMSDPFQIVKPDTFDGFM